MGKALYRKYRPTSLAAVVGQDELTKSLQSAIDHGKISHAYLFIGPRGCGKTSVARIFAHAINHFDYQLEDSYVDIIEIDAASNTGVDNIRELREKAIIAPTAGQYKVYIIDEVHMLSKSAFNALLKLLEEPPEHVVFIMATTDPQKVPITITSRAQTYTFHLASPTVMQQHLAQIAQSEQLNITADALAIIAKRGGGSFRDSISLLDQISTLANPQSEQPITAELVEHAFGLPQQEQIAQLLAAYQASDLDQINATLTNLLSAGTKPETIAADLIANILDHPQPNLLPLLNQLTSVTAPFPEAKLLLALTAALPTTPTAPTPIKQPTPPPAEAAPKAPADPKPVTVSTPPTSKPDIDPKSPPESVINPTPSATESVASPSSPPPTDFSWSTFVDTVIAKAPALRPPLNRTDYHYRQNTLHLYPATKVLKGILESPHNLAILQETAQAPINIHNHEDFSADSAVPTASNPQPPSTIPQISAIMGEIEEVKNGAIPF